MLNQSDEEKLKFPLNHNTLKNYHLMFKFFVWACLVIGTLLALAYSIHIGFMIRITSISDFVTVLILFLGAGVIMITLSHFFLTICIAIQYLILSPFEHDIHKFMVLFMKSKPKEFNNIVLYYPLTATRLDILPFGLIGVFFMFILSGSLYYSWYHSEIFWDIFAFIILSLIAVYKAARTKSGDYNDAERKRAAIIFIFAPTIICIAIFGFFRQLETVYTFTGVYQSNVNLAVKRDILYPIIFSESYNKSTEKELKHRFSCGKADKICFLNKVNILAQGFGDQTVIEIPISNKKSIRLSLKNEDILSKIIVKD